ncbi:MAG TPA: hypothetical protein VHX87_03770 [Galbitalea sp.]|nr:hypothetical protein [Galbitalea sp.]
MSKSRVWVLGVIAAMLVVVIGGWTIGISPVFTQITEADAQTSSIQASNAASQSQLATLKTQFAGISDLRANLDSLRLSIPEQQAASEFLSEVNSLSSSAGTTLQSVTISDATLYSAPGAAAAAAPATTSTPAPTSSPAPTTPTAPIVTSSGLVVIPVVVTVKGSLSQDQSFFGSLQTGLRLFVSSGLTITTDAASGKVTSSISGDIFTLQGSSDASSSSTSTPTDNSTTTPTPTETPTATPTPTSTPKPTSTAKSSTSGKPSSTPTPNPSPTS